jgi:hypothetical protein
MSLTVFLIVWGILGLAGFFTSIACFWYSSALFGVIGFLASIILGPFYWVFFFVMREFKLYCNSEPKMPVIMMTMPKNTKKGTKKKSSSSELVPLFKKNKNK